MMFQTTLKDPKIVGIRVWKACDLRTDFSSSKRNKKHTTKWRIVYIGGSKKKYSEIVDDPQGNPVWNHEVNIKLANRHEPLSILIVDSENNHAGQVILPITQFNQLGPQKQYHNLDPVEMEGDPELKVECLDSTKKNSNPKGRLYFWIWVKEYREEGLESSGRHDIKRVSSSVLHLPNANKLRDLFKSSQHLREEDGDDFTSSIDGHSYSGSKKPKKLPSIFKSDKRSESVPDHKMRNIRDSSTFSADHSNRRLTYAPDMHFENDAIADTLSEYSGSVVSSSNRSDYLSRYDSLRSSDALPVSERIHVVPDYYPHGYTSNVMDHSAGDMNHHDVSTLTLRTISTENSDVHGELQQRGMHTDNSSSSSIGSFGALMTRNCDKNGEPIFRKTIPNNGQNKSQQASHNQTTAIDEFAAKLSESRQPTASLIQNAKATYPDSGIGLQTDERHSSPTLSHDSLPPPSFPPPVPPPRLSQISIEDKVTKYESSEYTESSTVSRSSNKSIDKSLPHKNTDHLVRENLELKETLQNREEDIQQLKNQVITLRTELDSRSNDVDRLAKQLCELQSRLMMDGLLQYLGH